MEKWDTSLLNGFQLAVCPTDQWDRINDRLKLKLQIDDSQTVRVYRDAASAVFECAFGTAHFLAHKRSVGIFKGQTSYFESVTAHFYKQLLNVQTILPRDLNSVEDWVNGLKKDTSLVLVAEDHPITGEVYPFVDELDRLLNEKKIYCLRLSHRQWRYQPMSVAAYTVRIQIYDELCLAYCGERFKSPPMLAQVQPWKESDLVHLQKEYRHFEDKKLVLDFESSVSSFAASYFGELGKSEVSRLWDRSVLILKDVSSAALAELLAERQSLIMAELPVYSTNQCLTGTLRAFKGWWDPAPTAEVLSSLLVLPTVLLQQKDFASEFRAAYEEIKSLSSWQA